MTQEAPVVHGAPFSLLASFQGSKHSVINSENLVHRDVTLIAYPPVEVQSTRDRAIDVVENAKFGM